MTSKSKTMSWADLKYIIGTLTEAQLKEHVEVYNPFYGRNFTVSGVDHLQSYLEGKQVADDKLVIIIFDGK